MFAARLARIGRGALLAAVVLAAAVVCGVVVAGAVGGRRAELAVAGSVIAAVNVGCGVAVVRRALRRHLARVTGARAHYESASLVGLGLLVSGGFGAVAALRAVNGAPPAASVAFMALLVATLVYLPGMLLMSASGLSGMAKLRRGLDGLSVGTCALFTIWVLVIAPHGTVRDLGFWVALVTSCALAIAAATGLRAEVSVGRVCAGARGCAGAVALSVIGLAGLTLTTQSGRTGVAAALFSAALIVAPVLAWRGVARAETVDEVPPHEAIAAGHPFLALPASAAIVVALHRIVGGDDFDQPSVVLGVVGAGTIALREALAAADVSRYARRVVEQEARFRHLVIGSTDVIMVLDPDLIVRWQSPAATRQFGLSDRDVLGRYLPSLVHPDDAENLTRRLISTDAEAGGTAEHPTLVEARMRDGTGHWRETESTVSDQRDVPAVRGLVVHVRDVGERKEMQRALHRLAYADELTGLANRRQVLTSVASLRSLTPVQGSLLLVALDGFTAVNDVRGYDVGDIVLIEVARRLRAGLGESDLAARLSGDEFAVITQVPPVRAYALATRLLAMLAEPMVIGAVSVHLTASVGMTDLASGPTCDDVLRHADLALRRAKQLGRGHVECFDEAVEEALLRRMTLEIDLPGALARGELDLIYQPILDLVHDRPAAVEALLRWRHPTLSTLLPVDIIPVAEDLGLMPEIGSWVLHRACRQLGVWLRDGHDLSMMVNVSPRQLDCSGLRASVAGVLERHDLAANRLVLEVAETGLTMDSANTGQRLLELRALGVRTALDEFGTHAASLARLRHLPVDFVKVGPAFFAGIVPGPADPDAVAGPAPIPAPVGHPPAAIADVIAGLARRPGVDVVAHGLEEPAHLAVVRAAGCRFGQGHLFARPQPAERTEAYLDGFGAHSR